MADGGNAASPHSVSPAARGGSSPARAPVADVGERRRTSFAEGADIDEFVEMLARFERGEIGAEEWRKFRLVRGTYGQRQDDVQMLRVKVPQGVLTATQLETLADIAGTYARGFAHVTTRQNVQFHFLRLADVESIMRRLAVAGVTTREACGNSVRNITACPFAGVAAGEVFDVTPYAEALTRYLLRHPLAAILPRKFKIAFEGCEADHVLAAINDLGWTARITAHEGRPARGFRLTVGGGTSILPVSGRVLFDFLPAGDTLKVAEAILRVYHRLGDHEHKQRNRMKFLIRALGWERWRDEVLSTLDTVRSEGAAMLPFDPERPPEEQAPAWETLRAPDVAEVGRLVADERPMNGPGLVPIVRGSKATAAAFGEWRRTNAGAQRQRGYVSVIVRLVLGDVTAGQLRALAALARSYGDGTVRLAPDQNLLLRWVPEARLADLFARLCASGLGLPYASTIRDVTSCPGAESCRLAVTQSRGLARTLSDALDARPDLVALAEDSSIKVSGCPNGCGQHHVAMLGFQGSVRKVDGRAVPQYFVMTGGGVAADGATFARLAAKVPARRVGAAVTRLLEWYRDTRRNGESATEFFRRAQAAEVKRVLAGLEELTAESATAADYVDLGDTRAFTPEVMDGECAT